MSGQRLLLLAGTHVPERARGLPVRVRDRRREPHCTFRTAAAAGGRLSGARLQRLPSGTPR